MKRHNTNNVNEAVAYTADIGVNDSLLGRGELRYGIESEHDYFKEKPFVGYTGTEIDYLRQGLGSRRLFVMNLLSHELHGLPLYSDTLLTDEARRIWERLVEEGIAQKYREMDTTVEGGLDRYRFKD